MMQLEPNLGALAWFCLLWSACCISFLQLVGMYPLQRRSAAAVIAATLLWIALAAGTIKFAAVELRWSTIVVVGGVLFLFLPELFQALPLRWRDGRAGLAMSGCVMIVALVVLAQVAPSSLHTWLA
ncbi:hypothetical protein AS156_12910 [Bradyrhizobium macuxiense]|uniref:Uncharacterized protein n=1 Tax=Bradyrhizobium macuxiense TaxID=1755647 RepID=A0A109JM42_9BRAD|nr:hypothetical protein [Bradyrhizobium macuxiense]KWV51468.1 hypothetical protein AS156_12910 [Bradyrhizobium macuxiense]